MSRGQTKEGGAWASEAFTDAFAAIEHSFQGDGNAANFFMDTGDALADTWGDFKSSVMPIYDTADISVYCSEKRARTATETGTTNARVWRVCTCLCARTQNATQRRARGRDTNACTHARAHAHSRVRLQWMSLKIFFSKELGEHLVAIPKVQNVTTTAEAA